jgi:spore germination protein GerM
VPKDANVKTVTVKEGIATIDFNEKIYAGYGTEDEQIIVRGLLRVMAQFPEVKSVLFTTEGQPLDSLGAIDLSSPQPVEKS